MSLILCGESVDITLQYLCFCNRIFLLFLGRNGNYLIYKYIKRIGIIRIFAVLCQSFFEFSLLVCSECVKKVSCALGALYVMSCRRLRVGGGRIKVGSINSHRQKC